MKGAGELEEELKADNPKGRLWEACAGRAIAPPSVRHQALGTRHRVEMVLEVGPWELTSGVQWGWSRKVAEQMAARVLLEELEALERDEPGTCSAPAGASRRLEQLVGDEDVFEVQEHDVERLRRSNPKGQVYEWCQRQRPPVRRPRFEARPVGGRTVVRARLAALSLDSPWFRTPRRKDGEQAAAEALLALLPAEAGDGDAGTDATASANPRTVLNELVQHGHLVDCRVEIVAQRGPAHAPRFTAEASATLPDGVVVRAEPVEAASKRQALRGAAEGLMAQLGGAVPAL